MAITLAPPAAQQAVATECVTAGLKLELIDVTSDGQPVRHPSGSASPQVSIYNHRNGGAVRLVIMGNELLSYTSEEFHAAGRDAR